METTNLINLITTFLRLGNPAFRLQLYPYTDEARAWWCAVTDDNGPVEGLSQLAPEVLAERLTALKPRRGRQITSDERLDMRLLLQRFQTWARTAPQGSTDGGPALVLLANRSGYIFYDGREIAPWTTIAQALATTDNLSYSQAVIEQIGQLAPGLDWDEVYAAAPAWFTELFLIRKHLGTDAATTGAIAIRAIEAGDYDHPDRVHKAPYQVE